MNSVALNRTEGTEGTDAALHFAEKAREVAEFCVRRGASRTGQQTAFDGWDVRTLYRYVFFHTVTRTVFCVRSQGAIAAVAFVWGGPSYEFQVGSGKFPFRWQRSADAADALFVGHVVGAQKELPALLRQVKARWPDFERKRIFTFRHGAMHELSRETLGKMLNG
jgi:hypothetical protein